MYLWIVLFVLTFFIVRFNSDNEWIEYVVSIICRAFLSAVVVGIIMGTIIAYAPTEVKQYESYPIYSLKTNDKIQGNFVLFFGDVNNVKYYYYYLQLQNGNKQYQETRATNIQIRNTDEMSPQKIIYKEYYRLPDWVSYFGKRNLEGWGETKYEVLVIPKNAIQQVYDGNIK